MHVRLHASSLTGLLSIPSHISRDRQDQQLPFKVSPGKLLPSRVELIVANDRSWLVGLIDRLDLLLRELQMDTGCDSTSTGEIMHTS